MVRIVGNCIIDSLRRSAAYLTNNGKGLNLDYRKHRITIEQILEANKQVKGINAIARTLRTYPQLVRKLCADYNISLPKWQTRHDHSEVYMMYLDKGDAATAEHYGYTVENIHYVKKGIRAKIHGPWPDHNKARRTADYDAVHAMWKVSTPSETARHFDCSISMVRYIARSFGEPAKIKTAKYDYRAIYKSHLKYGSPATSKKFGCSYSAVRHIVNLIERKKAMSESDQPSTSIWKKVQ
jgi:hypothetical protein